VLQGMLDGLATTIPVIPRGAWVVLAAVRNLPRL